MARNKPFSFAHLWGGASAAENDDDDDKKTKKSKARRAEDDDNNAEDDDDDKKEKSRARSDENDDDEDDDKKEKSRARRADNDEDAEDGDDEDGEDDDDSKDARAARRAERTRCARIFSSKHAAGNPSLAASLAFNTGMSSAQAISVMASSGTVVPPEASTSQRRSLDDRMRAEGNIRLGHDANKSSSTGKAGLAEKMTSLYNNVTGKK